MAWSIRCNFDPIRSYAQALKVWKKAVIFTKDNHPRFPRGLVDKRKKHLTIELTEAEDFVLRLYTHPVVAWHKDNSVTIYSPRATRSTSKFATHCTPHGMYVSAWNDTCLCASIDGRTYKIKNQITFRERDGTWKADQITSPWSVRSVNRERAKQALAEVGYAEFRLWFKVYVQMASKPANLAGWLNNEDIIHMLRDRSRWRDLITGRFPNAWSHPDHVLSEIRQAIYQEYKCIDRKSVPFLG